MDSVFDRSPLFLYSQIQLPPSGITQTNIDLRWFANDTQKRYKENPHPTLKPSDILYRFNSMGYRCQEFAQPVSQNVLKIVSIGASEVFGVGLPDESIFPQVFCDKLGKVAGCDTINWNLGVSGSSADFISLYPGFSILRCRCSNQTSF